MKRYLKGYYIINTLLVLVYPILRTYYNTSPKLKQVDTMGYTKENGIIFTGLALLFVLWRKSTTTEHLLANIFMVGKLVSGALLLFSQLRIGLYYSLGCFLAFAFFRQPKYEGPTKMVKLLTEKQFEDRVLTPHKAVKKLRPGEEKGYQHMNMWLVEFYTDWADTCVYTKPTWAEYSLRYTTENLHFGEVNLMLVPELAKKYSINTSSVSRQLPTLILFEDGVEKERFPPYDEKTKRYMKVIKYDKKHIAKYFDLEQRYLTTRFANEEKKPTEDKKKN